jgi:hypothetical protein
LTDEIDTLRAEIAAAHRALAAHPVFAAVDDMAALRTFMTWHVFAVDRKSVV